ncbi:MAG: phosphate ABC transporter substrate-binding protein, partial [Paracoccaceae bacterium]|nr:phosphate ABC transporter substrate-binding protein [Paracoccaceae bacterium]
VYIKNAHRGVIPGLNEFVTEFVSEAAMGEGGYMQERGLTPLSADLIAKTEAAALDAVKMAAPES